MTSHKTPYPGSNEESFEDDGARGGFQRLFVQSEDGDEGRGIAETFEVGHAEKEGDGEDPAGDEADDDGAHDGDGDLAFGAADFFGEVGGAVEAGEGVVCVY